MRQMVEMITPAAGHAEPTPTIADLERHATERAQSYLVTIAQRLSHAGLTVHTRTVWPAGRADRRCGARV
jgi:hypothetical protein